MTMKSVTLSLALAVSTLVPSLVVPSLAWAEAEAKTDLQLWKDGKTQYNLGEFAKAIELWKQAYTLADKQAYLYNIGLAYEQLDDCKNALFFFQRFLKRAAEADGKPLDAATRTDVNDRVGKNEACVKAKAVTAPPDDKLPPDDTVGDTTKQPPDNELPPDEELVDDCITGDEESCGPSNTDAGKPRLIVARVAGGAGIVGAGPLNVPAQFTGVLTAGYPVALGDKLLLELGAGFAFTPVPYTTTNDMDGSAAFTSILANVGATYAVTPKIGLHGDLGIGVMLFSGLKEGNPFTDGGAPTTGALTMLSVRAGVTAEYSFTPSVSVFLTPIAFSFSPPKAGLLEEITSLTRLEFLAGVGFRR